MKELHAKDGTRISFRILNSAWMSSIREDQGRLFFPTSMVPEMPCADIRISIIHHPYNWFQSGNGRELRRILEATSDLVLTGHEHDPDEYVVIRQHSERAAYVEGGSFTGGTGDSPSFGIIMIDAKKAQYCAASFLWAAESFTCACAEPEWRPFVSATSRFAKEQLLSEEMRRFLSQPGLQLTHRAKSLVLEDIFVPPDLRTYERYDDDEGPFPGIIPSTLSVNKLFEDKYAYLLGDGQCGKTTLAKMLFTDALRRGCTPIYLEGTEVRRPEGNHLKQVIDQAISKQYSQLPSETFWQLEPQTRIAIIDDFGDTKLNPQGRARAAEWLKSRFGGVFLLGGDLTQIEDLIASRGDEATLAGFKRYDVLPFGHVLRDVLIEKWITLGREHDIEEDELQHELRRAADWVNRILGNNLLPANPIYILIILQQLEANIPLDTKSGSYGYFYETIITLALQRSSRSLEDVDAKYTYLSELAWHNFRHDATEIEEDDLDSFTERHLDDFGLTKDKGELQREIYESRVLQRYYGKCRFVYRYLAYYFVARYMRDNADDSEVQACIDRAADEIHREDFANILIFYTYLTKSKPVIRLVLDKARLLFRDVQPCDLADHVSFIGRLQERIPQVVLPEADPREQRRALLQSLDHAKLDSETPTDASDDEWQEMTGEEELRLLLSMNRAIKTLQVLGQILRNFSGSLKSELKREVTQECFDIGLRVLNAFYASLERHMETMLIALAELFGKDFSELPERKRVEAAKAFLFFITEIMCLSTLRRISYTVGCETLVRTYSAVEEVYDNRATRFVQLGLRLDHCKQFPEKRVLELLKEVENDVFGLTLLRMLVAEHFHLFLRPYKTRQRICQKLGISYQQTLGGVPTRPALENPRGQPPE